MWHVWERGEVHVQFLWGEKIQGRDHLEDLVADGRMVLKLFCKR
jgi:hypothetical protein